MVVDSELCVSEKSSLLHPWSYAVSSPRVLKTTLTEALREEKKVSQSNKRHLLAKKLSHCEAKVVLIYLVRLIYLYFVGLL